MLLQGSSSSSLWQRCAVVLLLLSVVGAEDPYRFFNWNVTYGDIFPLGVRQQKLKAELDGGHKLPSPDGILINGHGPNGAFFTVEQGAQDFYIVASTRFTDKILTTTGTLHYSNSNKPVSGPVPGGPTTQIDWSLNQARSVRFYRCPKVHVAETAHHSVHAQQHFAQMAGNTCSGICSTPHKLASKMVVSILYAYGGELEYVTPINFSQLAEAY
ncbi:hypothetical protein V6N13_105869 [Hibiscus sabdariffa]